MVEVTRQNFEALLPEIAEKIDKSTFLAIDAEYTGIFSVESKSSKSLFDTAAERYDKARHNAATFSSCQYGLAIFHKDRESNVYHVDAYNFYLFPVSFDAFAKRDLLTCQISCINFLARHQFDFNKFMREGIPYLNKEKAESLRVFLNANRHFMNTSEFLDPFYFPKRIQMITDDDINDIINQLAGFSKIIDIIHASRKPVVGHNLLTDLLITYQLFYANLPTSYDAFKRSTLESIFSIIYDTKFLAREVNYLRKSHDDEDFILSDTNLFALYTNTYSQFQLHMPLIETVGETKKYQKVLEAGRAKNLETIPSAECHSAGFDAVVTGCVFLNLCFMAARPRPGPEHRKGLPPTFSELLGRTEVWRHKINIARAIIPYVNLAGPDPKSHRPNWIIARSINGKFIDAHQMKMDLVKYGDIEVDIVSGKEVVVACGGMGCYRRVWSDLKRKGFFLTEKNITQKTMFSFFQRSNFAMKMLLGLGFGGAVVIAVRVLSRKIST